jgi:hypothetical protein
VVFLAREVRMPGTSFSIFHFPISHDKPVKQVKDGEGKKDPFWLFSNAYNSFKFLSEYEGYEAL